MNLCAVIMASGFSQRMGENKLLMKYRGKALAERVMDAVAGAGFAEIIVVTCHGAVAEMARRRHLTVVENDHPELGQSRSVVLGTQAAMAWVAGVHASVDWEPGIDARAGLEPGVQSGVGLEPGVDVAAACDPGIRAGTVWEPGIHAGAACKVENDGAVQGISGLMFFPADMPFLKPTFIRQLLDTFECHPSAIVRPRYDGKPGSPVIFPMEMAGELCQISGDNGGRQVIQRHPEAVVSVDIFDKRQGVDVDDPQEAAYWLRS